ncbi:hypothetical protein EW026_g4899 [Hermanssonia centrifuga]|uniref:Uncharacterized protein n=1 Tax=Hermanssonia centrifuga TaxID=98765 RepID=A0A4S4KG04_9APHY|nr:hypothetical protein EW026_g4899 [Hermanssonia centrifuga]
MDRAKHYLQRGHRHLIDILVDTCALEEHTPGYTIFREEFMPVFYMLIPYIKRWRSLSLKVRDLKCKVGARTALSTCGPAPALEYLKLWHVEHWDSPERLYTQIGPPPVVVFDKSLPSLKHINLIGVNLPWKHSPFLEDVSSINLGLHSDNVRIPYDLWAHMLSTSPDLAKLSLHYSGPRMEGPDWPSDVITLPNLHEITLKDLDLTYLMELFRRLSMPLVSRLQLQLSGSDFAPFLQYLADPPAPPKDVKDKTQAKETARGSVFPVLDTLVIKALECSAESFQKFLQCCKTVKKLEIGKAKIGDGLLEELMPKQHDELHVSQDKDKQWAPLHDARKLTGVTSLVPSGSGSRESSTDSDLSSSSVSLSTAKTTPPSEYSSLSSRPYPDIPLPELHTVRWSRFPSESLRSYIQFRRARGRPVKCWVVHERLRDAEMEAMADEMRKSGGDEKIVWFSRNDEEEEEEEEEAEDEGSEYDEEESYSEDEVEDAGEDGDDAADDE